MDLVAKDNSDRAGRMPFARVVDHLGKPQSFRAPPRLVEKLAKLPREMQAAGISMLSFDVQPPQSAFDAAAFKESARPGDFGADMMHYNPHKTFSGPHGGGGPGAGPICVTEKLKPYLPSPVVCQRDGRFALDYERAKSIGRVRAFFGNVGVLVRAYCYIRTHGPDGLRRAVSDRCVS